MPSVFAWVDFSEEDRRKMAEVIDLFREQDTRDELGLGVIRDALADLMFPGTSTIQTRAKYFLFVPWIYSRHETRGTSISEIARKARADEIRLIRALVAGGERDGVIGIEKQAELQRLASSIYWAGLGIWRIRRFRGSQEQYHRAWGSLARSYRSQALDDDREPLDGTSTFAWDPEIPKAPGDFLSSATLALNRGEAEYLQQRILGLGRTLLGHLVSETEPSRESELPWTHPEAGGFPPPFDTYVDHARSFSEGMHGAALLYNLMLAQTRQDPELIPHYSERFADWADLMAQRADVFHAWRREKFWDLVDSTKAHVTPHTRRFVDGWLDLARGTALPKIAESLAARSMIEDRERVLKRARARLSNPRALERWNGSAGAQQLNYRWHRVRAIVADVLQGIED